VLSTVMMYFPVVMWW